MAQSFLRQDTQLFKSNTYIDTLASGETALVTNSSNTEDDFNALRTQVHRIWDATLGLAFYTDSPTINSKKRSILQLNTDLDTSEEKIFIHGNEKLLDITVGSGQNSVILDVSLTQSPSEVASTLNTSEGAVVVVMTDQVETGDTTIGTPGLSNLSSTVGLVVGMEVSGSGIPASTTILSVDGPADITMNQNSTATAAGITITFNPIGTGQLTEVTGRNPISPENLLIIIDAVSCDAITSGTKRIYGLLQAEDGIADQNAFNDVDN